MGLSFKFFLTMAASAAKELVQEASEKFLTPDTRAKVSTALEQAKDAGQDTLIGILKDHAPEFLDKVAKAKGYNSEEALTKSDLKQILEQFQKQQQTPKAEEPKPAAKKNAPKKKPPAGKGPGK